MTKGPMMDTCHYHPNHAAEGTVTFTDGTMIRVCRPALNAALRWLSFATVKPDNSEAAPWWHEQREAAR